MYTTRKGRGGDVSGTWAVKRVGVFVNEKGRKWQQGTGKRAKKEREVNEYSYIKIDNHVRPSAQQYIVAAVCQAADQAVHGREEDRGEGRAASDPCPWQTRRHRARHTAPHRRR